MTTEAVELQRATGYHLVATNQAQLSAAHEKMIEWAQGQLSACDVELGEERANFSIAEQKHWSTAPFKRRIAMLEKRRVFYEKIELALQAGYVIVPNFEMTVFAIRTDARAPKGGVEEGHHRQFRQQPKLLEAGEGEFKNPLPDVVNDSDERPDGKGGTRYINLQWPDDEFNDIEFPIALAKPALMTATAHAMAEKVFDEIGVAHDSGASMVRGGARVDPIIIGRLRNPRPNRPAISFFIGWYFDPSNL